jgi:hypothetical protein
MSIKTVRLAICALLFFMVSSSLCAQQSAAAANDATLADRHLENVKIEAQSLGSLLSDLSLYYDIPIGLEIALDDDQYAIYHIDFKKGTLSDLLNQFVAQHSQYTWEIKDDVVNVFPKNKFRDLLFGNLLETTINSFSVKQKTNCWVLAKSLADTPEIKRILEDNNTTYRGRSFTGAYIPQVGRNFTLDVSNATLKSILNKVIKESPTAKFWLITRNSSDQTVFLSFGARHEDVPLKNGLPVSFN